MRCPNFILAFARDCRRLIHPGGVLLFVLVLLVSGVGFATVQGRQQELRTTQADLRTTQAELAGTQRDQRHNALTGCRRQNAQSTALLDLGEIITAARAQTSTSPRVRRAARDFLTQIDRLDPASPTSKALADLGVLLRGDRGAPTDARHLAAVEDDFIANAKRIEKPRDCDRLYGDHPGTRGHPNP